MFYNYFSKISYVPTPTYTYQHKRRRSRLCHRFPIIGTTLVKANYQFSLYIDLTYRQIGKGQLPNW